MQTLDCLKKGEEAVVHSLLGGRQFISRVSSMGFTPATDVTIVRSHGYGPIIVSLRGSEVALGRREAAKIRITEKK